MAFRSDSPSSPSRMTKAQFFRARSPPTASGAGNGNGSGGAGGDLDNNNNKYSGSTFSRPAGGQILGDRGTGSNSSMAARGDQGYASSIGTLGHTPELEDQPAVLRDPSAPPPASSRSQPTAMYASAPSSSSRFESMVQNGVAGPSSAPVGRRQQSERSSDGLFMPHAPYTETYGDKPLPRIIGTDGTSTEDGIGSDDMDGGHAGGDSKSEWGGAAGGSRGGMADGSDEMLLTLLASQAAVDCEQLPLGGWEEVDAWKKELSLLSTRLSSLVARHQREVKILTAARTLQKLNHANKRMSKQTLESLEQSEKRVEAAEKEVLVLRDRESGLRRRLNEHWAGVMAWEVRRLGRISADAQDRLERQTQLVTTAKGKEREAVAQRAQMAAQVTQLEAQVGKHRSKATELEEIVLEMGRRERALEQDMQQADRAKADLVKERDALAERVAAMERDKGASADTERRRFEQEREAWSAEKRDLMEKHFAMAGERERLLQEGVTSPKEKETMERVRTTLSQVLGRSTVIREHELAGAVDQVKSAMERRDKDIASLKAEMREVTAGLEEELRRAGSDRGAWKDKLDKAHAAHREEASLLQKQSRNLSEQLSDLSLRNDSLSASLQAAQTALANSSTSGATAKSLQARVDSLTAELDSIAGQFNEVWQILPSPSARSAANLTPSPRTPAQQPSSSNASPRALVSPTMAPINFAALQAMYNSSASTSSPRAGPAEQFGGIDEMVSRIRGMVEDGRLLVDRMIRLDREREMHKTNTAKAKKLVEDSRTSLETYQKQVAVLEDRLAKSGASESHFLEELNSLRSALDAAAIARRSLETKVAQQSEDNARLQKANDTLSARALDIADEAERQKRSAVEKLSAEVAALKRKLAEAEEAGDDERTRSQAQRIQLLDELNSLQAEVGELRKQLRQIKGG